MDKQLLVEILDIAKRAPSGVNSQPWQVLVLSEARTGEAVDAALASAQQIMKTTQAATFADAGSIWPVHAGRGEPSEVPAAAQEEILEEFRALRAPVAALCLVDTRLGHGSQLDYGMFLQAVRLAAQERGIAARALPAWQLATEAIRAPLGLEPHLVVLCGLTMRPGAADLVPASEGPQVTWLE